MTQNAGHGLGHVDKLSAAGVLITLGIIFGDIGTSPLYVMKSIVGTRVVSDLLILGGISCVFWTLTLQTTLKYVILTLRADNNGEGGIFSLYALIKRYAKWPLGVAMLGGAMLLADGIITPPISVASAVEGLVLIFPKIEKDTIVIITIIIITIIFFFQRFGTAVVGKFFGPIMIIWFSMLGVLGVSQIIHYPQIFAALNPVYAYRLLTEIPEGFWLLGAVFLCTTGAEALYSDLGHCGRANIRISWIFVKLCLLLNYFGQGAWMLDNMMGKQLTGNPFYAVMPEWFVLTGIIIATLAAIIASQALISGSFTLVSEAIRLNLFPKVEVDYPSNIKGQLYVPMVNTSLWIGCIGIVLYFRESSAMEAAYGLAITTTMLMTTLLLFVYLKVKRFNPIFVGLFLIVYLIIEGAFLVANMEKFQHGGYVTIIIAGVVLFIMYVRHHATNIKRRLTDFVKIKDYLPQLIPLSNDTTLPKYATNLVFLSSAQNDDEIEQKIMYSVLQKLPKRADIYWFIHIDTTDEPHTMEYKTTVFAKNDVIKVRFRLGFRVEQKISMFLRLVIQEMVKNKEIDIESRYHSLKEQNIVGDFRFVILEEVLSSDNELPFGEQFIMNADITIKHFTASPEKWFGLDTSLVIIEKVPLIIRPAKDIKLQRII